MSQTAQDVIETAREAIEGVREWAGEVAETALEKVNEKVSPPKKKRSKLPLLLVLVGLGAVAFYLLRRRNAESVAEVAPDAFGAAVEAEAENANRNGERSPAATPGV